MPAPVGSAPASLTEVLGRVEEARARFDRFAWTNALLQVDFTRVEAEVRSSSAQWAPGEGSLAGTLFSVKDLFATAGIVSTAGSLLLADNVPEKDAVVVERLRAAGSVLVGKGNCAEFGFGIDSENRVGGRVLHPSHPAVSPGGSSGGDAVAVATRVVDFGIGTDYGGSVRWPAQAVGVLGLRTGVGLVPRTGELPGCGDLSGAGTGVRNPWSLLGALETVGILARSPRTLVDVLRTIRGSDRRDWLTQLPGFGPIPLDGAPRRRRGRLAVSDLPGLGVLTSPVAAAMGRVRATIDGLGLERVEVPDALDGAFETYRVLRQSLDHHVEVRALSAGREDLLCQTTREALAAQLPATGMTLEVAKAWSTREDVAAGVRALLDDVDVLIVPVAAYPPLAYGAAALGGAGLDPGEVMRHCRAVSLTGLPALSVPFDDAPAGQGVSIQIVGPDGGEELCCEVAIELGRAIGSSWAHRSADRDSRWI
jgi:amidase